MRTGVKSSEHLLRVLTRNCDEQTLYCRFTSTVQSKTCTSSCISSLFQTEASMEMQQRVLAAFSTHSRFNLHLLDHMSPQASLFIKLRLLMTLMRNSERSLPRSPQMCQSTNMSTSLPTCPFFVMRDELQAAHQLL